MSKADIPLSRYGYALLTNITVSPSTVSEGQYVATGECECSKGWQRAYSATEQDARKSVERKHRRHLETCEKQAELARDFPPAQF
jgi:hypothetical protein